MTSTRYLILFVCLLLQLSCFAQVNDSPVSINIPSIHQEATSIWRTINDISFLEQQGYNIHLPKHDSIQSLMVKSKQKTFGNQDFETIYTLLESGIYHQAQYDLALDKVEAQKALINRLINQLKMAKRRWNWDFKIFDVYPIVFTLYGTGGSYDPESGTVTLFTNTEGEFMNYEQPANTIMHEIVHMGIEASIVQKYNLPHALKERIVDKITYLLFKSSLPEYRVQNMGDPKIDQYLKSPKDLANLHLAIERYLKE